MTISFDRRFLLALAVPALMGCETLGFPGATAPEQAAAEAPVAKTTLDAAIEAAGGQEALARVKELAWTGTATVNAEGKTTEIQMDTIVRPFAYGRFSSWPKGERKGVRTIQTEYGKAWTNDRFSWTPVPEAQAVHENQQMALYSMMLLVGLKDPAARVTETAPGQDGTRNLHVEHPAGPPTDLRFDKSGKLVQAANSVRDPKGGAAPTPQAITFSGEMTSNGVKWPKRISITHNGQPYFDLELATFEARPAISTTPIPETLGEQDQNAPVTSPTSRQ